MSQEDFLVGFAAVAVVTAVGIHIIEWFRLKSQNRQSEPDATDARENDTHRASANFAALIDTIRDEGRRNRGEEQREDRGKKVREWLTILLLSVTVYFLYRQVDEMKLVYCPIKDQADAAKRTAENSRAWVGPLNATFGAEPTPANPLDITILYSNSGHDPASGFVTFVTPFIAPAADEAFAINKMQTYLADCKKLKDWTGGSVVYPTSGGPFGSNGFQYSTKAPIGFVTDGVAKGDDMIIVQGCFGYRTSEIVRHSYFCYFYKHDVTKVQNLNICASGHYAD